MTTLRTPFSAAFTDAAAEDLAAVIKALACPPRLAILSLLAANGEMSGEDIIAALVKLSQPTVAYHLKVLTEAGIIESRRLGPFNMRKLAADRMREISRLLDPGDAR